jgi:hypothetical protein
MEGFQCTDPRDKLYGILSLVDWGQESRPVPDYSKDSFEVAADALCIIVKTQRSSPWWLYVILLCQIFEITPETTSLRRAIEIRSGPSGKASRSEDARLVQASSGWKYIQIGNHPGTSVSQTDDGTPYLGLEQCQNFSKLWTGQETVVACVPLDTRAGDRFVYDDDLGGRIRGGVIARASEEGEYSIIGPTVSWSKNKLQDYADLRYLTAHWNIEDILVCAWKSIHMSPEEASDDEISEFVNMRVCGSSDSSYFTE